ncbi:hypothetical protein [Cumulibacter soli]|uniref:hypothetical protein n=1 Tax=Cumulibacter soli TaxID=2546344 RepID=UPI001067C5DF|nr:hypothetical protein [Cumulibacter soli]
MAWPLVESDFQQHYGLDLVDEIQKRSWRWFRVRYLYLPPTSATKQHQRKRVDTENPTIQANDKPDPDTGLELFDD